jgi:hypothetical protein
MIHLPEAAKLSGSAASWHQWSTSFLRSWYPETPAAACKILVASPPKQTFLWRFSDQTKVFQFQTGLASFILLHHGFER